MTDLAPEMSKPSSFREIIELWGAKDAHGARLALGSEIGAPAGAVTKWWQRNNIPAEWWARLLSTERAQEAGVSAELLTDLAARDFVEVRA